MEIAAIKMLWIVIGMISSLLVGILSFVIRNGISKNATKENIQAKTDLLEKDIGHIVRDIVLCENKFDNIHKRISELRENSKDLYVSKELFHQTIKQLNDKLDTILKFVKP